MDEPSTENVLINCSILSFLGEKKIMCALFEIGKGRRRDHRGDCQSRTTQRHQQGTLAVFV